MITHVCVSRCGNF